MVNLSLQAAQHQASGSVPEGERGRLGMHAAPLRAQGQPAIRQLGRQSRR